MSASLALCEVNHRRPVEPQSGPIMRKDCHVINVLAIFWSVSAPPQQSTWECYSTYLNFVEIEWQICQNSFAFAVWWTVYSFVLSHFSFLKTILALYPSALNHIYINTSGFVRDLVSMFPTTGYLPHRLSSYPWHCVNLLVTFACYVSIWLLVTITTRYRIYVIIQEQNDRELMT